MAGGKKKKETARMPRNYELARGIMRFSRARMYAKRGVWAKKPFEKAKKSGLKKDKFVVKKVGGDKNSGERKVAIDKGSKLMTEFRKPGGRVAFGKGKAKPAMRLRSSLTPGTVLIMLAGRHKGKRVVFLKQLQRSGLLLVTGPMKLNSCPLRRIAQAFVIATTTKLDVSQVQVPEHVDDAYFRRFHAKKQPRKEDADLFNTGKTEYVVSEQRKTDQKTVDTAILEAIRRHPDKKTLFGYLGSRFSLQKNQYPHKMKF